MAWDMWEMRSNSARQERGIGRRKGGEKRLKMCTRVTLLLCYAIEFEL